MPAAAAAVHWSTIIDLTRGADVPDASFVTDRLATGAANWTDEDIQAAIALGITHVISCNDGQDATVLFAPYHGITYLWAPVSDDGQPKPASWFEKGITFALPALANPHARVFAHCSGGHNRGPSMAFGIMLALGFPPDLAEQLMRQRRPQIGFGPGPGEQGLAYKGDAIAAVPALGY